MIRLLFLLFIIFFGLKSIAIEFTEEEKEYLASNPVIKVHNELNWLPFNFNEKNQPKGLSIDFMNLVAQKVGLNIEYISGPTWNEFLTMIQNNKIDVMLNIVYTQERKKFLSFTTPYQLAPHAVVLNKSSNQRIDSIDDLSKLTIAVEEGFVSHLFMKENYPNTTLILKKDTLSLLQAISYGEADATFGILSTIHSTIEKNGLNNLKLIYIEDNNLFAPKGLCMATSIDNPILRDILQKGLNSLTNKEKSDITNKWINIKTTNIDYKLIFEIIGPFLIIFIGTTYWVWRLKKIQKKLEKSNLIIDNILKELQEIHKSTKESIEYAGMIQSALISSPEVLKKYFKESYAVWQAKDTVGGDIYIFEEINEDECLIFVIDCTGHGVPGALVTVLVKSIERNIFSNILKGKDKEISPANLLKVFNRSIKNLLKQNDKSSLSNAGFDGTILYYNKKTNQVKFASANNIVMILTDGKIIEYKGDRHSIGYKTSDSDYIFKEYILDVKDDDMFFLSTDGLYDQNGGKKDLPMGRKKIKNILLENSSESLNDIKELILYELGKYQGENERNDDISFVSFKI